MFFSYLTDFLAPKMKRNAQETHAPISPSSGVKIKNLKPPPTTWWFQPSWIICLLNLFISSRSEKSKICETIASRLALVACEMMHSPTTSIVLQGITIKVVGECIKAGDSSWCQCWQHARPFYGWRKKWLPYTPTQEKNISHHYISNSNIQSIAGLRAWVDYNIHTVCSIQRRYWNRNTR